MDKLIETVQKLAEAEDFLIMTYDAVKSEAQSLEKLVSTISPGDLIAGMVTRVVLSSFSPRLLKDLDKMGIGPGLPRQKGKMYEEVS
ncbi:MAG TPA: hypothetical protein VMV84_04885 [Dehalococcoidales bacterium]|nr:hypothetical protein [Dehalococcoidales bacterium]